MSKIEKSRKLLELLRFKTRIDLVNTQFLISNPELDRILSEFVNKIIPDLLEYVAELYGELFTDEELDKLIAIFEKPLIQKLIDVEVDDEISYKIATKGMLLLSLNSGELFSVEPPGENNDPGESDS